MNTIDMMLEGATWTPIAERPDFGGAIQPIPAFSISPALGLADAGDYRTVRQRLTLAIWRRCSASVRRKNWRRILSG